MKVPLNTYRIQFSKNFTFRDMEQIIPYLKELGIDCIYASPIFKAVPGSDHGYDQTDPHQINPEIGTLTELRIIKEELKKNNIKWLQDIVPNHMAFHSENHWLMDVLEKGKESEFWNFFDINWYHPYYKGKLMTPVLSESLKEAIESNKIRLKLTDHGICICYLDHTFPASINSYKFIIESANTLKRKVLSIISRDEEIQENLNRFAENKLLLREFLELQNFDLVPWHETDTKINYRRFFTINSLISLKMEEESVFHYFHKFIFQLVKEEIFDGLRIDHIDGLLEPDVYLERLRKAVGRDTYFVVEKILEPREIIPQKWPVQGTTGYDFLANVNRVLTSENNYDVLQNIYSNYTNTEMAFDKAAYNNKYNFLRKYMGGDLQNLFLILKELLPNTDITALASLLAGMPVYRLYPNKNGLSQSDKNLLISAAEIAKENEKRDGIDDILKLMLEGKGDQWHYFMQRFQQLSCPLSAKGVEDTTFYQYNLLISHNEVGDNPEFKKYFVSDFSNFINNRGPQNINTTATHDTKRGEDARMRINSIAEFPGKWETFLVEVEKINNNSNTIPPDKNDLYFLYQSVIGSISTHRVEKKYIERLTNYMIKAVREGKINSDWANPNETYEKKIKIYIESLLNNKDFINQIRDITSACSFYGSLNSLSQLVLKCTLPGVADFYQGCELWDFNFVDPDNRRPVDYNYRKKLLENTKTSDFEEIVKKFLKNNNDAEVKCYFVHKLLQQRLGNKELFLNGGFEQIEAEGNFNKNLYSFKRKYNKNELIVSCGRTLSSVYDINELSNAKWGNTEINTKSTGEFVDILTNKKYLINNKIQVKELFSHFPVSVIIKKQYEE